MADAPIDPIASALKALRESMPSFLGLRRKRRAALLDALEAIGSEFRSLRQENDELRLKLLGDGGVDLDAFYLHFENRYRGSEEAIRAKLTPYLDDLEFLDARRKEAKILDIGCGRGEWLKLLAEQGFKNAAGVDANERMVEACREKGLDLVCDDAFDFLEKSKPDTYDAITGFHIIEHFPFGRLLTLLQLCHRALRPGGTVILETPNPRNIIVGGNTFYFDPTHVRPVPCELLGSAAEHVGFTVRRIYQRNAYPDLLKAADALPEDAKLLRNVLTCGLDYGAVLEKPGS